MELVVTIDTEEDNWAHYSATDNPVSNIEKLEPLQKLFGRYGVRPTYLVTYPVATNPRSVEILKGILENGECEIGMHCHPWNTPPFEEQISDINSLLCNLPEPLVLRKLTVLHEAICENFAIVPESFRAGRWGFNSSVARALCQLGYRVDTSVSPFDNLSVSHGPDYSGFQLHPYRFEPDDIATPRDDGALLEVPATVGFLQSDFERCRNWTVSLEKDLGKKLRVKGILSRLGLLNKVWLSPEIGDVRRMIRLAKRVGGMSYPNLNMFFHSTNLMAGLSPFVVTRDDETAFLKTIEDFLAYTSASNIKSVTLNQFTL
jgi:hypothetical protein